MTTDVLPHADATSRLAPPRRFGERARTRALQAAVVGAVLLHLVAGALLLLHPPAFLVPGSPPPPLREAQIEMVQNDMPATGDQPVGGTGKTKLNAQAETPAAPPPAAPPPQQAQTPPPAPELPTAPDGETPPPQPAQPEPPAPPQPQSPPQQAQPAPEQKPIEEPKGDAPDIRLSSSDDYQGMAGGTAETPAAPDPAARNKLPAYPREAATKGEQGEVDMVVHIAPDGSPAQVIVANSSGSRSLDGAAVLAVQRWRFRPALDHGVPVPSDTPVRLNFVLRGTTR